MAEEQDETPVGPSPAGEATLEAAVATVLRALGERARHDEPLRASIALIGRALLALAERPEVCVEEPLPPPAAEPGAEPDAEPDAAKAKAAAEPAPPAPASPPATEEDLRRLARVLMGQEPPAEEPPSHTWQRPPPPSAPLDLQSIIDRCDVKSAILMWYAEQPASSPRSRVPHSIIARAKALPDCQLWMLRYETSFAIDHGHAAMLAGSLATMSAACAAIVVIDKHALAPALLRAAIEIAAEAQSALRAALRLAGVAAEDHDQLELFQWLRQRASEEQFYIDRYMRKGAPADPLGWEERLDRARQIGAKVVQITERRRRQRNLLGTLRYRIKKEVAGAASHEERTAAWTRVGETLDLLVESGMPPTHLSLRPALAPYLDTIPEGLALTPRAASIIESVAAHRASDAVSAPAGAESSDEDDDPLVAEVAELLRDQSVVVLGGERRPYTIQAIREAFDLGELIWCTTEEGQSYLSIEPYIKRPDVVLVILAIRWASHNLSEATSLCTRHNKLLVRLPAGYNASQIAHQVMQQVGDRLQALAAEREG
ncbi:hypothetical protein K2Z83_20495 [Oscillochloris sp. ZM17-4]|uniref:hypothetical protein n=1 Tax=Oscillochloris sp. ZM17-4 TaxID=2866714 RepID=UPI001C73012D|nr:hypothetical protein [Oscillochloris sp. ZM17-4]MBX0330052.1 hypothetical protein [Oscillochloris sp. ZM17-4]